MKDANRTILDVPRVKLEHRCKLGTSTTSTPLEVRSTRTRA